MNKKTPVPAYRLISNLSNKLKVFINHYETPCSYKAKPKLGQLQLMLSLAQLNPSLFRPIFAENAHFQG